VSVTIPYVREMTPHYGEPEVVSPSVRRVLAHNPNRFTYLGSGTYLIGRGAVAVIDAGPDESTHVDAILRALEPGERITHLFVTHRHTDHVGAVLELQERTGADTYGYAWEGSPDDREPFVPFVFGDPEADHDDSFAPGDARERTLLSFHPDVALTDGDVVHGGTWALEAVHTPGHAADHLCYGLAEEGLLMTGDHVMGWSTSVIAPPGGDLNAYLSSLELLLGRGDTWYLPTHGPAVTEPRSLVEALLAHRRERSQQILDALADGPRTIAEIVPRLYADVAKQLWQGAGASVWAHVLALAASGAVEPAEGSLIRSSRLRRCSGDAGDPIRTPGTPGASAP
jgi:glyoxylase-like metal-dependent hydrolase (beta-lactamase superfamily II)